MMTLGLIHSARQIQEIANFQFTEGFLLSKKGNFREFLGGFVERLRRLCEDTFGLVSLPTGREYIAELPEAMAKLDSNLLTLFSFRFRSLFSASGVKPSLLLLHEHPRRRS